MSEKLNPMELFLDKFKSVNYEKFAGNDYVIRQLDATEIDTVVFSKITQTLIEDEGQRLRRSTNINTPGFLIAYNQRWTTAFFISPEASTLGAMPPIHVDDVKLDEGASVFTYYETPPNIDDLPAGTETVQVRVRLGATIPDSVPDKLQFLFEMLYPYAKYEFGKQHLSYVGNNIYLLDTPTIYEYIRVFQFSISPNYLTIPPTFYGKMQNG
ncbi:hypothetical protein [Shewanella phage FishSpeaker]|nr:hypothetical protein [Shewanella phage FishSpeaker]